MGKIIPLVKTEPQGRNLPTKLLGTHKPTMTQQFKLTVWYHCTFPKARALTRNQLGLKIFPIQPGWQKKQIFLENTILIFSFVSTADAISFSLCSLALLGPVIQVSVISRLLHCESQFSTYLFPKQHL